MANGVQDKRLMCRVEGLEYDFRTREGRIYFPHLNCCDMTGCVALFVAIDPKVKVIHTFAGLMPDTVYVRVGASSQWQAGILKGWAAGTPDRQEPR